MVFAWRSQACVNAIMILRAKAAKIKNALATAPETESAIKDFAFAPKDSWASIALLKAAPTSALDKASAMTGFASAALDSKEKTAPKPIKAKTSLSARLDVLTNALSNVMLIHLIALLLVPKNALQSKA